MADSELEEIRKQRLAQLKSEYKTGTPSQASEKAKEEQIQAEEDKKNAILTQILDQSARARLNTLMLGKPEKGRMVENMLLRMAQMGQISTKISEKELIGFLEHFSQQTNSSSAVKFDRRRCALDSDDDL